LFDGLNLNDESFDGLNLNNKCHIHLDWFKNICSLLFKIRFKLLYYFIHVLVLYFH